MSYGANSLPAPIIQEGRTAFYEHLQAKNIEARQQLSESMRWFRPVDRLLKSRQIEQLDRLLANIGQTVIESRLTDEEQKTIASMPHAS